MNYKAETFTIPEHELEITASRAGGPGGQHVNKSSTRITVRWNVRSTMALTDEEKVRVEEKLKSQITAEGDILVSYGGSRSQQHNKEFAIQQLTQKIRKALFIPKKRLKTRVSKSAKEARLESKARHSAIKKLRSQKFE